MKIVVFGAGAAGSAFAGYLRSGGADVVLVDRNEPHMRAVREKGLRFVIHRQAEDGARDEERLLTGFRTYTSAEEAAAAEGAAEIILYMTKATQLEQAVLDSRPLLCENTVAVSLINGLGNDDVLLRFFDRQRCVIGSGVLGTFLPEPGLCIVTPGASIHMNFGGITRSPASDEACRRMLACFTAGGCLAYWRADDIYHYLWTKVILNCTVNAPCAILRLRAGYVDEDPAGRRLNHSIIRECCAVATAKGVPFDADRFILEEYRDSINHIYDYYPSMAQDVMMRRQQTEIDNLNGKIVEYGEALGIDTPVCRVLTELIRCMQANYDRQYGTELPDE